MKIVTPETDTGGRADADADVTGALYEAVQARSRTEPRNASAPPLGEMATAHAMPLSDLAAGALGSTMCERLTDRLKAQYPDLFDVATMHSEHYIGYPAVQDSILLERDVRAAIGNVPMRVVFGVGGEAVASAYTREAGVAA